MEKKIKLIMDSTKNIHIWVNDKEKYSIDNASRQITARTIFDILEHSIGDVYNISYENIDNKDVEVLMFFVHLIKDITNKIQEIKLDDGI